MNPIVGTSSPAQNLRRLSWWMARACLLLIVLLPILAIAYWQWADPAQLALRAQLPVDAIRAPLTSAQRWAGAVVTFVPLLFFCAGLWQARACFRLFEAGEVFTAATVRCLRRFAGWVSVSVAASMVAATATSVVLTFHNPPGARHLAISFGTDQVFTLFFAGMVWVMATVIGQGRALAEENAAFV